MGQALNLKLIVGLLWVNYINNLKRLRDYSLDQLIIFDYLVYFLVTSSFALLAGQHHDWWVIVLDSPVGKVDMKNKLASLLSKEKEMPSVDKLHVNLKSQWVWVDALVIVQHVSLKDLKHKLPERVVVWYLFLLTCHLLGKYHHDLQRHFSFVGLAFRWIDLLKNVPDQLQAWVY